MTKPQAHVNTEKKSQVAQALKLIEESPIIGLVNMENLPARQLQVMKEQLRGKVTLFMTKKRLLRIALKQAQKNKQGLEALEPYLKGMPALLTTSENPFSLYKTIKKSKSPAPAKAGQKAPKDILVKAGATNFAPGPIIGELGSIGLKAGIEAGKIAIKEDKIVAKEGDTITEKLAGLLLRLGVSPMEVGLDVTAVYENGTIYDRKLLDIDEEQFLADLATAARNALALALERALPTKESINMLIGKAHKESIAIAIDRSIITEDTRELLLARAQAQAQSLQHKQS